MALLMRTTSDRGPWWRDEFKKALPDLEFRLHPEIGNPADIEYALVWDPPPGLLASLPALKVIFSMGAGVDHLFKDPALPRHLPVVRIVDARLTGLMVEYAVMYALRFHRDIPTYEEQQRQKVWKELSLKQCSDRRVGVMGLGEIGGAVARAMAALGFDVAGWSRRPKDIAGVRSFAGKEGLTPFLARSDIVICVLPLTPDTADILDARAFAAMPRGSYVINIGRGRQLVEPDLLAALDNGQLAGAALDVFRAEPLPPDSPLWSHPRLLVTPHLAAATDPRSSVAQIVENIKRDRAGQKPINTIDTQAGY
ncbi:MAG: glyoxylate/hydroxypyruvate reductase A [Alphaproteobacteria bacterium]|nr:glyoxylate/hydroxypyruvate reductase A [Alphaproteobacteria bacterium]